MENVDLESVKSFVDTLWVIDCAILVFIMQAGFMCMETGLSRHKNSINVALKNAADFGVAVVIFWIFGFGLMFGKSYNGYTSMAKRKAVENAMFQVSLAQSEYYNDKGEYYYNEASATCTPSEASSNNIETNLFDNADIITKDAGYWVCIAGSGNDFLIMSKNSEDNTDTCKPQLAKGGTVSRPGC